VYVCRYAVPPRGVPGFHQPDLDEFQQLVASSRIPSPYGVWCLRWEAAERPPFSCTRTLPYRLWDRLLFILAYVKTYSLQGVQGACSAWARARPPVDPVLLPVLLTALRTLGECPARSLTAPAQRLGVSEADAASLVGSVEELHPFATPDSPLLPMTGRNGASSAPRPC